LVGNLLGVDDVGRYVGSLDGVVEVVEDGLLVGITLGKNVDLVVGEIVAD